MSVTAHNNSPLGTMAEQIGRFGFVSLLATVLYFGFGFFQPAAASSAQMIAAANSEGALTIYYCDDSLKNTVENFHKLYPKITLTTYDAGCWQAYNRYVTERTAGRRVAGVFMATEDVQRKLQSDNYLENYQSPERSAFPAMAKPAGRYYTLIKTIIFGLTSNKDFAGQMPQPKDWFDFVNPPAAWKDQISFYDPRSSSTAFLLLATLYQNFGPDKTASIYKGLIGAGAELSPTTSAGIAKLLSGEKPIMFYILDNHYMNALNHGAPLTFTVPSSGTVTMPLAVSVTNDAPQPNAARLFTDYMLNEAQGLIAAAGDYALREGSPPVAKLPKLSEVKTLPLDIEKALADQKKLIAWWQTATGIR